MSSDKRPAQSSRTRSALVQLALLLAGFGFVGWIIVSRGGDLKAAFRLTPGIFVIITLADLAGFLLNGIELQVLTARFGGCVPFLEGQALGLMVSTLNYLPMKAGTVLNGVLLRARHSVRLSDYTALIAGSSVVHLSVCGVLAGAALLAGGGEHAALGLVFLLTPIALVIALVTWGNARKTGRFEGHDSRVVRLAARAVDGLGDMFSDGSLLAKDVSINIGLVTLWAVRSYWSFRALGVHPAFGSVLTVTALGIVFNRLSIIPGGVGFREAGSALGSTITGIPAELGFAASVIDRAVELIWLLLLGVPATLYVMRINGVGLGDALRGAQNQGGQEPRELA